MRGDWAPAKVGHRAMRRFLGQTALVVGGTGGALFAAGAVYFRSRNASPIQHTEFPEAAGKTFIVTGGTSGIGKAVVKQLARSGAHVIVGARNGGRRAALAAEMRAQPGARVDVLPLDIASASSVVTFAASVEKLLAGRRLDGLCNNAAVIKCSEQRTAAGLEMTFATNALGPFHLTNCLLPLLSKGEGGERARVVNVGSRLESRGWIDPKALLEHGDMHALPQSAPKPAAMMVYASSKLGNTLFTTELHRRLQAETRPVDCLCVSPGMVDTSLWRDYPLWYRTLTWPFRKAYLRTADEAAAGVTYALVSRDFQNAGGRLVSDGRFIEMSSKGSDPKLAAELWRVSEVLVNAALALSISLSLSDSAQPRQGA